MHVGDVLHGHKPFPHTTTPFSGEQRRPLRCVSKPLEIPRVLAVLAVPFMFWLLFWSGADAGGVQPHGFIPIEPRDPSLDIVVVFSVAIVAVMNAVGLLRGWKIARLTTVALSVGLFWLALASSPAKYGESPDPFAEPFFPALAGVVALYSGWVVSKNGDAAFLLRSLNQ